MKKFLIPFLAGIAVIFLIAAQPKIGTRFVVLETDGLLTNATIVTGKSLAATNVVALDAVANRPAFLSADGSVTNASGTPDGTKFMRDDGVLAVPTGGEATTNGTLQPFDVSKTWIVFMGDSITAGGAGVTAYPERVTNLTHWRTPAFFTNQAAGGTTFHIQTNVFWTNTLPLLPAVATNGTNVIISIQAGINDFNSGSNFLAMQASHQVFSDALHARGYIVVRTTLMPFEPNNDLTFSNIFRFNSWVRSASNHFDRVADFARRLPNSYDLDFWYVDRIHPTNSGQFELTKEWDTAVRFNTLPQPDRFDKWQRTWQVHDSDGLMRVSIGSEFYGSNDISGIFFNGDNLSGNQTGIYITNNASPADMIYNVINQGNHVFREGNVEILRFGEAGLSTPMLTLTGTGTASSGATGLVFDNPGGTGNDVGIWRDSADSRGIFYHSGIGGNIGFHSWTIGDTPYLVLDIPAGHPRLRSNATTNSFGGLITGARVVATNSLVVGLANGAAITNILAGSATLNFAAQNLGGSEDLPITVTGAKDGDAVSLGYESTVATGIIGSFSAWASNGVVFVRFISTAATQNPNSGVFRVVVTEF